VHDDRYKLDTIDRKILDILAKDSRATAADLARETSVAASTAQRRLARLKSTGVIVKFTTIVAHEKVGPLAEAFVTVTLDPKANAGSFVDKAIKLPFVREGSQVSGALDVILRMRAESNDQIGDVVNQMREMKEVSKAETLFALHRQRHAEGGRDAIREAP
jgi:DNA-binding Lrp family transcriptional regulator